MSCHWCYAANRVSHVLCLWRKRSLTMGTKTLGRVGGRVMTSNTKRLCVIFMIVAWVIAVAEISVKAAEVEPILEHLTVRMAQAPITPEPAPSIGPTSESSRVLVGHWRKTTILFDQPKDEHLVLRADGTAENWTVTVSSRSATRTGRWKIEGKTLDLLFEGNEHISQPFTIYQGQLVFPNISNRRRFWEKIDG